IERLLAQKIDERRMRGTFVPRRVAELITLLPIDRHRALFALPDARLRDAPLIFARVFTQQKRQVARAQQREIAREKFIQRLECVETPPVALVTAEPVCGRRELARPRAWRRDDELSAGPDKLGKFQHELQRLL